MRELKRGEIQHRNRARQLRDYSELCFANITPTDIDGFIEYKNRGYIIIELKYTNSDMPFGQRLALERLTDDLGRGNKSSICILATHREDNPFSDINVANTLVLEYRQNGKWLSCGNKLITTKQLVTQFIHQINLR